jgi:hypothetical protein
MPAPERVTVDDFVKWGNLLKGWATGKDYPGVDAQVIPRTIDELKQQCADIGLGITIPAKVKSLAIISYSEEVLVLRVPPKSMIEESETHLSQPGTKYNVPAFYDTAYGVPLSVPDNKKLDFHACRIGDYSISNCT